VKKSLDLAEYLPYLVNRVGFALVARFTREALAREDLSIAMWRVLVALSNVGEQRQVDIAGMTSIDVSTLSRLVTRLMRRGLVTRRRSNVSSREVMVALSASGAELMRKLVPIAAKLERDALRGISAKDLAVVKRSLRRAHENLSG
jgi:MarR family transcriptional regulator, organic hydroperoxide resistance regulator